MNKTLNDIQPGDKVLSEGRWHKGIYSVERVTKNYVIVHGQKFRKTDGNLVGPDRWNRDHITPLTSELLVQYNKEFLHKQLCTQVKRINFESLTIEQLRAIFNITQNKNKNE